MKVLRIFLAFAACSTLATASTEWERGFENPPPSARPRMWWHWMNGNITSNGITADLESMAAVGIGGVQLFNAGAGIPAGPVVYNSPAWQAMLKHAVAEAHRLGLAFGMHNCAGWSSSGGPWVTPEHSMKRVTTSETCVKGPMRFKGKLPVPPIVRGFYRDIAVVAFPRLEKESRIPGLDYKILIKRKSVAEGDVELSQIWKDLKSLPPLTTGEVVARDRIQMLTDRMDSDGVVDWDAPAGDWVILRVGFTTIGEKNAPAPAGGLGLECDKLSRVAVDAFWQGQLAGLIQALGPLAGAMPTGFNNVLVDSYERGPQNWTDGFEKIFRDRIGYELAHYWPTFTGRYVGSREETERFFWDFRRVIADLFTENYAGELMRLAHQSGLQFVCEPYGNGPADNLQYGGACDVPMCEFWVSNNARATVRKSHTPQVVSSAHVFGKPIVCSESFSARPPKFGKWQNDPYALKAIGDSAFCSGVNQFYFHRFAHQPWVKPARLPGMTLGMWGTHFDRTVTWWEPGRAWFRYLARCQYLLQAGLPVADVCFYCGEDAPNDRALAVPAGYACDGFPTTLLKQLQVRDGRIVFPCGMSYRLLMLPGGRMSPEVLRTIADLVRAGAAIAGPQPEAAPGLRNYPASQAETLRLAKSLWPTVVRDESVEAALRRFRLGPDFICTNSLVQFAHRVIQGADVYFVANAAKQASDLPCAFRVTGRIPELWDPETGRHVRAPVYRVEEGYTRLVLHFEPAGAVFVVFRKPESGDHAISLAWDKATPSPKATIEADAAGQLTLLADVAAKVCVSTASNCTLTASAADVPPPVKLAGEWTLAFPPGWGAPADVRLTNLISWTEHADPGVNYFSGTATYRKRFTWTHGKAADERYWLDLGEVKNLAEVNLNGRALGVLWKPPFRVEMTELLRSGENRLEIKVTNLWPNRIIGDEHLPPDCEWDDARLKKWPQWLLEGKPSPTGRHTFVTWHHWQAGDTLLPSGLFGPVCVQTVKQVPLKETK